MPATLSLADPQAEERRQRLLDKLADHPELRYAVETYEKEDGAYIIALATPMATCELLVPKPADSLDFTFRLVKMIERLDKPTLH